MAQIKPETKKVIKKTLLKVAFYFGLVTGVLSGKSPSMETAGKAYTALFPEETTLYTSAPKAAAPSKV